MSHHQVTNLDVGLVLSTVQNPALTITKIPNPSTYTDEASVTYTYLITNTGNVTLSILLITDNTPGTILGSLNTLLLHPVQASYRYIYLHNNPDRLYNG